MWPVCQFPGQVQQPSDSRYLLFLWQLGRRCACWPVRHTWRFWPLPGSPLHLPLWQCRDTATVSGTVTSQAIGLPLDHGISVLLLLLLRLLLYIDDAESPRAALFSGDELRHGVGGSVWTHFTRIEFDVPGRQRRRYCRAGRLDVDQCHHRSSLHRRRH